MKVSSILFIFVTLATVIACKNKKSIQPEQLILPYTNYIQEEAKSIDSIPYSKWLITTNNTTMATDSMLLTTKGWDSVIQAFIKPIIYDLIPTSYTQSSFADRATGLTNITYQANTQTLPVQQVIVSLNAVNSTQNFFSIQITKKFAKGEKKIQQQLLWQSNVNATINTITDSAGITNYATQKLVWF